MELQCLKCADDHQQNHAHEGFWHQRIKTLLGWVSTLAQAQFQNKEPHSAQSTLDMNIFQQVLSGIDSLVAQLLEVKAKITDLQTLYQHISQPYLDMDVLKQQKQVQGIFRTIFDQSTHEQLQETVDNLIMFIAFEADDNKVSPSHRNR